MYCDGIIFIGIKVIKSVFYSGVGCLFWLCECSGNEFFVVKFVVVIDVNSFYECVEFFYCGICRFEF